VNDVQLPTAASIRAGVPGAPQTSGEAPSAPVLLSTINARYPHAALGLRYLLANAGDLQDRIRLVELVSGRPTEEMAQRLLAHGPVIIGFGVYIWNVLQTTELVRRLKSLSPDLTIIVGGPEVSHEAERQEICRLADYVVQGPGDVSFARLVRSILHGPKPIMRIIAGEQPDLADLVLPYRHFTEQDIRDRFLYVEASRGCPFKCEFCLSALDKTAIAFPLESFLAEIAGLHARGARRFKFVDRTFNLKPAASLAIMEFFIDRIEAAPADPCFVHFELVPDHLPEKLKSSISRFPPGTLQLEIGIQTFNPQVQALISRRQDNDKAQSNLRWLLDHSRAHLHVDLIAGLPGESLASFGDGFDRLTRIAPHEIQLGILKRLRGAPITRHEGSGGLRFDPQPPYEVVETDAMTRDDLQAVRLLARFHGLIVNSGRMPRLAALCMAERPFARLLALSHHLFSHFGRTHAIGLEALFDAVLDWLRRDPLQDRARLEQEALADYRACGARGRLAFMATGLSGASSPVVGQTSAAPATPARQTRHLQNAVEAQALPVDAAGPSVL
jgi:radical SAM superfamily enzyme YgiQ (UPF0313 family)